MANFTLVANGIPTIVTKEKNHQQIIRSNSKLPNEAKQYLNSSTRCIHRYNFFSNGANCNLASLNIEVQLESQ